MSLILYTFFKTTFSKIKVHYTEKGHNFNQQHLTTCAPLRMMWFSRHLASGVGWGRIRCEGQYNSFYQCNCSGYRELFSAHRQKTSGWCLLLVDQTHCGTAILLRTALKPPAKENYFVRSSGRGFDHRTIEQKWRCLSHCVDTHLCVCEFSGELSHLGRPLHLPV